MGKNELLHIIAGYYNSYILNPQSFRQYCCVTEDFDDVSDLVGELQELQSATSTSTAADLLKQGAGRT